MSSKRQVPKLRFPEFSGEWRTVTVGDFFAGAENHEKATSFESDKILTVKLHGNGVVRNERTGTLTGGTNYVKRRAGQFIFSKIDLLNGAFGIVPEELDGFYSSTDVPAYSFNPDRSPEFFLSWLRDNYKRLAIERTGTSATLKRVAPNTFRAVSLLAPCPSEQRKIAKCLTSLDELIAAEGRRLEALRKHKKALLQNLFPTSSGSEKSEGRSEKTADGEPFSLPNSQFSPLIPRLRFPEFREAGEWQEEPLGDLVRFQSGGTPSKAEQRFWNGSMPWVTAKDMKPFLLEDTEDHITTDATEDGAKQVPAGTTLILTRGMTLLKDLPICIVQRPMSFNQDVKALRPLGELNELFLAYLLFSKKPLVLKMVDVAGHGTGRLDTDKLRALVLTLPNGKEQNRIASCLSSLDTLIAEQAKKLATLKTHKQGLMQGLFPSEK